MGCLVLITGGSRSGKSRHAADLAARIGGDSVTFVATCQPMDDEMVGRVAAHKADRPPQWQTVEEPLRLAEAIHAVSSEAAIIDCLAELQALVDVVQASAATVIVVTNEVGMGLVPEYPLGRAFRDIAGRAGQFLATHADEVYLTVLGIPVKLKPVA